MTETPILNESAVSEIEDRAAYVNTRFEERIILTPAERDALCATVKQLRAENERLNAVVRPMKTTTKKRWQKLRICEMADRQYSIECAHCGCSFWSYNSYAWRVCNDCFKFGHRGDSSKECQACRAENTTPRTEGEM